MKLWLDDIRRPPDDSWTWARTNAEAKAVLESEDVTEASLDHDLGLHDHDPDGVPDEDLMMPSVTWLRDSFEDGYDLAKWMVEHDYIPPKVCLHSWNPPGAQNMAKTLEPYCAVTVEPYRSP